MPDQTDEQIAGFLVHILTASFNRSLGALEDAGALDTKKMHAHYKGIGSKYYDIVTEQIELTANIAAPALRQLFQ